MPRVDHVEQVNGKYPLSILTGLTESIEGTGCPEIFLFFFQSVFFIQWRDTVQQRLQVISSPPVGPFPSRSYTKPHNPFSKNRRQELQFRCLLQYFPEFVGRFKIHAAAKFTERQHELRLVVIIFVVPVGSVKCYPLLIFCSKSSHSGLLFGDAPEWTAYLSHPALLTGKAACQNGH